MKAVVQRVTHASVSVRREIVGQISQGLMVLIGIGPNDTPEAAEKMAKKLVNLRIFSDDEGKMNLSVDDIRGEMLIVSQFTLYGDTQKGNRPSFVNAAPPEIAEPLYEKLVESVAIQGIRVATGEFGADMQVTLVNDGPVTLLLELSG